jgi:hypothetical protein
MTMTQKALLHGDRSSGGGGGSSSDTRQFLGAGSLPAAAQLISSSARTCHVPSAKPSQLIQNKLPNTSPRNVHLPGAGVLQVDYEVHPQHRKDGKEALPASLVSSICGTWAGHKLYLLLVLLKPNPSQPVAVLYCNVK